MRRTSLGICLIALCTLMVELLLTRVFDVVLYPNLGYMIITAAMFSLGLAGIYTTLKPPPADGVGQRLSRLAFWFGLSLLVIRPALNAIPFEYTAIASNPVRQLLYFAAIYLVITVPFFLAGLIFCHAFTSYATSIQSLYAWDLTGAAVGCVVLVPALPYLGPGGLLFVATAIAMAAAWLFHPGGRWRTVLLATVAAVSFLPPLAVMPGYLEFVEHKSDRGLRDARRDGRSELTHWDPISKVEVIDLGVSKNIVYDGGSQSSFIYPFSGDFGRLRTVLDRAIRANAEAIVLRHFWQRSVFLSHYLKRDSDQRVLVIGSAAGQEVKAALTYGAGHVDGVEMVGVVVDLGKTTYARYNGNVLNEPRANVVRGEGRSFLRASAAAGARYDIIQIWSNHASSSVAAGVGALDPAYLLTADSFVEYFNGLSDDGILQVNHHTYPRIIATAALAWKWLEREDFQRHVVVTSRAVDRDDSLPTVLIKMTPWTARELQDVRYFLSMRPGYDPKFKIDENPRRNEESFLSAEFYSGELSDELLEQVPYRITPTTDDRPYFKFLRRDMSRVRANVSLFVWPETSRRLNMQLAQGGGVPMDVIHLLVSAFVSVLFGIVFVLVPLLFSSVGRGRWRGKYTSLTYFSCLGAGFIIIELVLIQKLLRFVGYPLYTYSLVLFTLLLAAGIGSMASAKLRVSPGSRWWWPFAGVLGYGVFLLATHMTILDRFLGLPTVPRMAIAAAYIFPLGFFLGMPFPLGILAVERVARGAVAWAWGMNGLFTVVGGLASVLLSVYLGFNAALVVALAMYAVAMGCMVRMRAVAGRAALPRLQDKASANS